MESLAGIKVLDLTRLLPGPYCTMILGDFGAEVIKIEQPESGDYARWYQPLFKGMGYRHIILNRNKKSITIDLKCKEGKEIFYKLAKDADVIIESFRPGVVKKLSIDYNSIKEINHKIIYCSLSGFGQTGPLKMEAGHDLNYISLAGITSLTGQRDGKPYIPGIQIADLTGGLFALNGILMGLLTRNNTNEGQYIDISMHDCAISLLPSDASNLFGGLGVTRRGESRLTGQLPNYSIYETSDGRYMAVGALEEKFWENFCHAIDRKDLIDRIQDPNDRERLFEDMESIFRRKTQKDWILLLEGKDTCITPVCELDEVFEHPQVKTREMILEVEDEKLGKHKQLGIPVKLSKTPGMIKFSAPELGEHTEEILISLGFNKEEICRLRSNKII
jgi:crotonobetainyl-CoA:carnitine CoA-transferase CaiB-like acyl-CoA transferase